MDKLILEEIQRMKLLSKYDNSKTLSEQNTKLLTPDQAIANDLYVNGVGRAGTDETNILDAIEKIETPQQYNQVNREFMSKAKKSIVSMINSEFGDGDAKVVSDMVNHLKSKGINIGSKSAEGGKTGLAGGHFRGDLKMNYSTAAPTANTTTEKPGAGGTKQPGAGGTKQPGAGGTKQPAKPVATPPELTDIKAFQDWLDDKRPGWATGYKDGIITKGQNGGGYGKFGPRTQKAWATYKDQFLKGGDTATKAPPEIEGEDNTQIIDPNANDGEFGGEATTAQSTKVETPPTNDQAVTLQGNPKSTITTGQPEKPTSAIYGQQYKASDGKTYVWSGTEYKVQA